MSEQPKNACEVSVSEYLMLKTGLEVEHIVEVENIIRNNTHHQPAFEGDVVDRVARAIYQTSPAHFGGTTVAVPWEEAAPPYKEDVYAEAKAAIAALQPAIDKARADAKAEERARCVEACRNISTNLFEASSDKAAADFIIKAIEQGRGDA